MGKNKRKGPTLEEVLERPWCYYCERDFDDMKILINHQKAKHLKCSLCPRRLDTAGGLSVHMQQVHKEPLTMIENAISGRENPEVEIFGVTGIPADVEEAHRAKITAQFGSHSNGTPNNTNGQPAKKIKLETPEELKKRLAEHKAKKAAAAAGITSGSASPAVNTESPHNAQVESQFQAPPTAAPVNVFNGPVPHPQAGSPTPFNQPFGQPQAPQYPPQAFPHQQAFPPQQAYPPQAYPPQPYPPQQFPPPQFPPQQMQFQPQYPPQPFSPPAGAYGMPPHQMARPGPGYPGYGSPNPGQYMHQPPAQYGPPHNQPRAQGWQQGPPNGSPHPQNGQAPRPSQQSPIPTPPRPSGLPAVPGLPARPAFDTPPVSKAQLSQIHQGHKADVGFTVARVDDHNNHSLQQDALERLIADGRADAARRDAEREQSLQSEQQPNAKAVESSSHVEAKENHDAPSDKQQVQQFAGATIDSGLQTQDQPRTPASLDQQSNKGTPNGQKEEASKSAAPTEKVKKTVVLVVRDQETSPEEKMARMSRYSFTPRKVQA